MNNNKLIASKPLDVAVLFLVFNRPDHTQQVFDVIKKTRPTRFYIAADGHRSHIKGEKGIVNGVREMILNQIDWECNVQTLFRDENLGCGLAVSGAIDWFFSQEEKGIILEDDCIPALSFFPFAESMLIKYADNQDVGTIGGFNMYSSSLLNNENSYSFIKFPVVWGWATWRRTWESYKFDISEYSKSEVKSVVYRTTENPNTRRFFVKGIYDTAQNKIDTWDYQLMFSLFSRGVYSIVPNKNLIENVGFGADATHTFDPNSSLAKVKKEELYPPYIYKGEVQNNEGLTKFYEENKHQLGLWLNFKMNVRELLSQWI